jgi:transcriptional regulator with XRE-family HTH domain
LFTNHGIFFLKKGGYAVRRKTKEPYMFGSYLRELRERKGVTLKQVEKATGLSNAYISQLETGVRRRLPAPDRLKILADYFNVTISELLAKAGYVDSGEIKETFEQKIEKAFVHVINDPDFKYGTRVKKEYDLDTKRFIVEMYEKATGKKLL